MGKENVQPVTVQVQEVFVAVKIPIVYEDDAVIVVNKPAGLAAIPGRGETSSLLEQLGAQCRLPVSGDADPRLRVVHRLDKDTSGVMLFARNLPAQRMLSHQFQNNTVSKEYLAIVLGTPAQSEGIIEAPIAPDRQHVGSMKVDKRGKPAVTQWKIEESFRGLTIIRAFPRTGKTHQIRVHLKHIGHPLVVDPLYGPDPDEKGPGLFLSRYKRDYRLGKWANERPLIARLTLHAQSLTLTLPSGQVRSFTAELPKDFRATLNMLRKYARG